MNIAAALHVDTFDLQTDGCELLQIGEPIMIRYHEKVRAYGGAALDRYLDNVVSPLGQTRIDRARLWANDDRPCFDT